ncbi:adipokinetic hormone/corazonin-related peptide receptor variant I-like [Eriocheir sinensis]|uniref:adipokinetic hormone/corazonin-related peptide receptor variant I-like n=1 Tax=Eriocheir sinensis TaxID=95602 RepID=UPI0021C776DF|nr:adipokinetic hormone/corazonin-related peptide receptor variant I-like [Eriocheir sinensis]
MIMHLAAADLLVTLINFPLEVGWRVTTQWLAGNLACKMFQFMRAFGLYLSSLVLVCISLDRYFAIVHPLKVNDAQRRGKMMVCLAWSVAAVCSLPQSVIFHVDSHPQFPQFKQCVTFGFFRTHTEEAAYNLFGLAAMYFLPLTIIIIVYFRILWEISQKSKDSEEPKKRKGRGGSIGGVGRGGGLGSKKTGGGENHPGGGGGRLRLRRSDMSNIERARARTLRMTVIIVLAFVWCWTPYVIIMMWYTFDRASAEQVDKRLQDSLFIMAVSNSCVNPIVYGTYTINLRGELDKCFGRRRGGGGRGISGVNSSLHHVTTRRSTTGHSIVVRSTVASQGGVSTCHKTSLTQLSGRKPSIQGASNPPRAPPKPFPHQDVGSSCVMIEMEPQVSLNPPPDPMKGDPWPGKESKDTNMKDPSLNPPSDPMKGDSWPGKESKEPNIKDPSLNPLGGDSWAQSKSRDANKDSPEDLVPMTSLVPGLEVNAGSEAAGRENGVAGGGDGGGGGGVVVLTAC